MGSQLAKAWFWGPGLAAAIVWASYWATTAVASEAVVSQIPATKQVLCAECLVIVDDDDENASTVTGGPPNTHDIVQVGDGNVAIGISLGQDNYIGQFQYGVGNHSAVGLIADDTSVTVVQDGNYLESNLLIWGNPNADIGVYQPPGSAPVNAAIFTADDGTQVIFPGNATTVIRR